MRVVVKDVKVSFVSVEILMEFINSSLDPEEFVRWLNNKKEACNFLSLRHGGRFEVVDKSSNEVKFIVNLPPSQFPFQSLVERLPSSLSLLEEVYIVEKTLGIPVNIEPIVP